MRRSCVHGVRIALGDVGTPGRVRCPLSLPQADSASGAETYGAAGPKRPTTAYFYFVAENREDVKAENPDADFGTVSRILGTEYVVVWRLPVSSEGQGTSSHGAPRPFARPCEGGAR